MKEKYIAPATMKVIAFGKKYVANTWIHRLPFTEWLYRKIFYLGTEIGEKTIPFHGMQLTVNTKDISMVPSLMNNNFEEFELNVFSSMIKPGSIILDVGANIGVYSLIAARHTGSKGRVYAFEPVPENFELLSRNIRQNELKNVVCINKAVGSSNGKIEMEIEKGSIATHYVSSSPKNPTAVPVTTIDSFIKNKKISRVDLIKMDIEGYEGFAIEGGLSLLKQPRIKLLMEFSADFIALSGKQPEAVAAKLLELFSHCYFLDEKQKRLTRVSGIDDLLDYKKTNFLMSHKAVNLTATPNPRRGA